MKRFAGVSSVLFLFVFSTGAFAAAMEPSDIVRMTTEKVLERIKSEKESLRADPGKMYNLVSEMIFPHFDFGIMSKWVLGKHWLEADEEARETFVEQFRKLLVRTYATALLNFSDQSITYPPIDQTGSANTALVKQQITQPGSATIPIIYRLHNKSGDWKVFDVSVDGVSLVKTYRASFGSIINNDGLSGLLDSMTSKNRQYSQ
jgi:phospholipid transport system substrate-binding protein